MFPRSSTSFWAAALGDLNLIQHHQGLEAVQLAAEMDAGVILGHQHVAEQLGHMLRLFHVVGAGLIVHILGLWGLRGAHHSRNDRLGGRGRPRGPAPPAAPLRPL